MANLENGDYIELQVINGKFYYIDGSGRFKEFPSGGGGGGGTFSGSGTAKTITWFTAATTLGDSPLSVSGAGDSDLNFVGELFKVGGGANTMSIGSNGAITKINTASGFSGILSIDLNIGLSANRTWDMPNASGTVALTSDLSGYLPLAGGTMTGAINTNGSDINLAVNGDKLGIGSSGASLTQDSIDSIITLDLSASSGFALKNSSGFKNLFVVSSSTAQRTFTFKDESGTVAFLTDISITNISEGTSTLTTVDVNSSDGSNATLQPASTLRAGVMTKAKFDEVVANNAKVSASGLVSTHSDVSVDQAQALVGTTPDAPTAINPYATKLYVDAVAAGVTPKAAVDLATSVADGDITLSGEQTIDGVLTSSSRVLVKSQTLPAQNGIYDTSAGAWTRTSDFDDSPAGEVQVGSYAFVLNGTENNKTGWMVDVFAGTIDVDPIEFVQFQGLPTNHAATHIEGGIDEIDGDLLAISFVPSNYTPVPVTGTAGALDAQLKGIDNALLTAGGDGNGIYDGGGTIPSTTVATVTDNFTFSGGQVGISPAATLFPTGNQTIDWNTGNSQTLDFGSHGGGAILLSFNNPQAGFTYSIKVIQGANNSTITYAANVLWESATPLIPSSTDDAIDLITMYYDGVNYLASYGTNFS